MMDFYETLEVPKDALDDDIKRSYRKLSMKHHPDRGGDKKKFQEINEAYQTLSDVNKKRVYDMKGVNPLSHIFNGANDTSGLFSMFFGGDGMQFANGGHPNVRIFQNGIPVNMEQRRKPPCIIKTIEITLKQSFKGINFPLEIERWVKEGDTRRVETEKLYIDVKQGVDNNEIILLENMGNITDNNVKGDIKLYIKVTNHTEYIRDGLDLIFKKTITLKEALIGFNFDIEHISGKTFKINNINGSIIKPFYNKHIEGLGMVRNGKKGMLIISFEINFPKILTDEQKTQLNLIL